MRLRAAALVLSVLAATPACRRVKHVPAEQGKPEAEAPGGAAPGVPPRAGRPGVPAAPEALLADGAVAEIQRALAARGLLGGHREGELDARTSGALRRFQEEEGLAATGFPDRETVRRLGIDPEEAYRQSGSAGR